MYLLHNTQLKYWMCALFSVRCTQLIILNHVTQGLIWIVFKERFHNWHRYTVNVQHTVGTLKYPIISIGWYSWLEIFKILNLLIKRNKQFQFFLPISSGHLTSKCSKSQDAMKYRNGFSSYLAQATWFRPLKSYCFCLVSKLNIRNKKRPVHIITEEVVFSPFRSILP